MRRVTQIELTSTRMYAVCDDGTLWFSPAVAEHEWQPDWKPLVRPPDGKADVVVEKTLEEQAEEIAARGGRQMVIGKGKT